MLRQLVDGLRSQAPSLRGPREMDRLLKQAIGDWADSLPLISRPGTYTRTCAYRDESFEVLLLNWAPGSASPVHDHGDQHCWMLVLAGRLQVEDYVRLDPGNVSGYAHIEPADCRELEAGGLDARSGRFDLHRVAATRNGPAVSLHVYSAPLRRYLIYDELSRRCESTYGIYDEVLSAYTPAGRA